MRLSPLALLAACAAPELQLPPPPNLVIATPALTAGQPSQLTVTGAPAGATVRLGWGPDVAVDALCPALLAPHCVDLAAPQAVLAPAVADASGRATFTFTPPDAPQVALQAFVKVGRRAALSQPVVAPVAEPAVSDDPCGFTDGHAILFTTSIPIPEDFGMRIATFGNHKGSPHYAGRGGDLYVRYPDGSLRNLTAEAGMGLPLPNGDEDPARSIAVREPVVHWDGDRAIVSIAEGADLPGWSTTTRTWQLYEVTGLCPGEPATFTRLPLPADYNHVAPAWTSDGRVLFVSDMPPTGPQDRHLYPLRDEYEGNPIPSGVWSLDPATGAWHILEHSPSGSFGPLVDSFGRVVFSRWDHLKRDQKGPGDPRPTFDWPDESAQGPVAPPGVHFDELFPELQSSVQEAWIAAGLLPADFGDHYSPNDFNQFFPWMMHQDGSEEETLNHVGRHELGGSYAFASRPDDPQLAEDMRRFAADPLTSDLTDRFGLHHFAEDPTHPGRYYATIAGEFDAKGGGQLVYIDGGPDVNADDMRITWVTHPDTRTPVYPGDGPRPGRTGLYRDPLPLQDGTLLAVATAPVGPSSEADAAWRGSRTAASAYAWRLHTMVQGPDGYLRMGAPLTPGITKTVRFWYGGNNFQRTFQGTLWELDPVELVRRPAPPLTRAAVHPIEAQTVADAGGDLAALQRWLAERDLALIVSRDVTQRDHHDLQQPFNLRVPGGVEHVGPDCGPGCRVYDVTHLQLFEAQYVRGQDWAFRPDDPSFNPNTFQPTSGRRVLPRPVLGAPNPPADPGLPENTVRVAADGSVAAIVPARRALSWQLIDEATPGDPAIGTDAVVRERYWVTLQPGEVRTCPACHGVNTESQTGDPGPTNPPQALAELIAWWTAGMP
jgi:hypothetical protein